VRWNDLFSDLEGQFAAAHASEFESGVRDLAQAERATVRLAERLASSVSAPVTLTLRGGVHVSGMVSDVTGAWVLLADGGREQLVPLGAISMARGVGHRATSLGAVAARLGLGHALRALAREGASVIVLTSGGELRGRIDQVGADHLDLSPSGGGAVAVAFTEVLMIAQAGVAP
jgi:sRNA-binding regulator protein Hfq